MSDVLVFVLELIGTVAFAVSGAIVGIKKQMDLFGVIVLGICTAVGGGIVRDLILGVTPPVTFQNPVYTLTAAAVSVLMFLPHMRARIGRHEPVFDRLLLVMDAVGLGVFTVVGVQCAYQQSEDYTLFLLIFVGLITGVGGGVLRDVFSGERPYIFVRHFYACASIVGALICALCWRALGGNAAMLFGAANESAYYADFTVKCFRIYLCLMPLATLNKGTFIYLQALGKALASTAVSLTREIIFGVFLPILLPIFLGLDGLLWSFPAADLLTFLLAVFFIRRTYRELSAGNVCPSPEEA